MEQTLTKENSILYREYNQVKDSSQHFNLLISEPKMINTNEYKCIYSIVGKEINITFPVYGHDSLQALLLALFNAYSEIIANNLKATISELGEESTDFIQFNTNLRKYIRPELI